MLSPGFETHEDEYQTYQTPVTKTGRQGPDEVRINTLEYRPYALLPYRIRVLAVPRFCALAPTCSCSGGPASQPAHRTES